MLESSQGVVAVLDENFSIPPVHVATVHVPACL